MRGEEEDGVEKRDGGVKKGRRVIHYSGIGKKGLRLLKETSLQEETHLSSNSGHLRGDDRFVRRIAAVVCITSHVLARRNVHKLYGSADFAD